MARPIYPVDTVVSVVWNPRARAAAKRTEAEIVKVKQALRKCMANDKTLCGIDTDPGRLAKRYRKLMRKWQCIYFTGSYLIAAGE